MKSPLIISLALLCINTFSFGQSYNSITSSGQQFTEDFNNHTDPITMATDLPTWSVFIDGVEQGSLDLSDGSSPAARVAYNFGDNLSDGAIGFNGIDEEVGGAVLTTNSWSHTIGWRFTNNTGSDIKYIATEYIQEAFSTGVDDARFQFFYQTSDFSNIEIGNGTAVEELDGGAVTTDGAVEAISGSITLETPLANGESIVLGFALSGSVTAIAFSTASVELPSIGIDDVIVTFYSEFDTWYLQNGATSLNAENWTPFVDLSNEYNILPEAGLVNSNSTFIVGQNSEITAASTVTIDASSTLQIADNISLGLNNTNIDLTGTIILGNNSELTFDIVSPFAAPVIDNDGKENEVIYNYFGETFGAVYTGNYYNLTISNGHGTALGFDAGVNINGDFSYLHNVTNDISGINEITFTGTECVINCPNITALETGFPDINVSGGSTLTFGSGFVVNDGEANEYETFELNSTNLNVTGTVNIPANKSLILETFSTLQVDGTLNIANDGGLDIQEGAVAGAGTVNATRSQPVSGKFNYWSNPFNDATITVGQGGDVAGSRAYYYKGGEDDNSDFVKITGAPISMQLGKGYASLNNSSTVFSSSVANINQGDVTYNYGADNDEDGDDDDFDFYLVGNPYLTSISSFDFISKNAGTDNNINGTIYVFSQVNQTGSLEGDADNIAINLSGASDVATDREIDISSDGDFHIASGQGFFITDNTGDGDDIVTFSTNMQTNENMDFKASREDVRYRFWISLENDVKYKTTLLAFVDGATAGFDNLWDAANGISTGMDVWTESKSKEYEIQAFPPIEEITEFIPVGLRVNEVKEHQLRLAAMDRFPSDPVYLFDQQEGAFHDLRDGAYPFEVEEAGEIRNRFYLAFIGSGVTELPEVAMDTKANVSIVNGVLKVTAPDQTSLQSLQVISIDGKIITEQNDLGNRSVITIPSHVNYFVLRYSLSNGYESSMKFLNN